MDMLFFYWSNVDTTNWVILGVIFLFIFVVLSLDEFALSISVTVFLAALFFFGYLGYAKFSPEISEQEYQEVLNFKKVAIEGNHYSSEFNQNILHVFDMALEDKKINNFEKMVIDQVKTKADKGVYISKLNNLKSELKNLKKEG